MAIGPDRWCVAHWLNIALFVAVADVWVTAVVVPVVMNFAPATIWTRRWRLPDSHWGLHRVVGRIAALVGVAGHGLLDRCLALRVVATVLRQAGTHQTTGTCTHNGAIAPANGLTDKGPRHGANPGAHHGVEFVCMCLWRKASQTARQYQQANPACTMRRSDGRNEG